MATLFGIYAFPSYLRSPSLDIFYCKFIAVGFLLLSLGFSQSSFIKVSPYYALKRRFPISFNNLFYNFLRYIASFIMAYGIRGPRISIMLIINLLFISIFSLL